MKGQLQIMKHMEGEEDETMKKKITEMSEQLKEKIEEMEDLESLNQALVIKERKSNDELQEARKELIHVRLLINFITDLSPSHFVFTLFVRILGLSAFIWHIIFYIVHNPPICLTYAGAA